MRTIYRVEDERGVGPYQSKFWYGTTNWNKMVHAHAGENYPELPHSYDADGGWHCAFDSLAELGHWFAGFIHTLQCHGFKFVELQVQNAETYAPDDALPQCFFKKENVVSSRVLTDLELVRYS